MDGNRSAISTRPGRLSRTLYVGPVLLFAAAVAYGVLEVHPANDTWIGLAAGRQILGADEFPRTDTFSYTAVGRVWYNQNWLTHVVQYWAYDSISPDAIIYLNWALAGSVFTLTLLAAYWRSATWIGALLAASVVALGCRDFVGPRPATTGFFCLASLCALLCALEAQRGKRRWWPIALLLPLLLVWGNAHGSFVFGYGVLGLYVLHWGGVRALRRPAASDGSQMAALVAVVVAAAALIAAFGPFGIHNFTHGEKVAGSAVWRDVAEWQPPYVSEQNFPPVWRFWTILGGSAAVLLACTSLRLVAPRSAQPERRSDGARVTPFDIAMLAIGLGMTLWARRFAPVFLVFGAPTMLVAVMTLMQPLRESWRRNLKRGLMVAAGLSGVAVSVATASMARADLVERYVDRPEFGLLERVTQYDTVPHDALIFIGQNDLHLNLLAEWSLAGTVMLHASNARVFIDGRAQQVYDETQYREYHTLFVASNAPRQLMHRILDKSETDGILLRLGERGAHLAATLEQSPDWVPVLLEPGYRLFLRKGSGGLEHLGDILRRGEAWWPDSAAGLAGRAFVWWSATPPDLEQAVSCWDRALRKAPALGTMCFRPLTGALLDAGRDGEARRRVAAYTKLLNHPLADLSEEQRREALDVLEECRADIEAAAPEVHSPD